MKLAPIALAFACLLAGCNSSTPTPVPPTPAGSPAARVDASAPAVNGVQAPPSSGDPAPSASAAPRPTPTPDPEAIRTAAAAGFLEAGVANVQAVGALPWRKNDAGRLYAEVWARYLAALETLQVPADTTADLHDLIRKVTRFQAVAREGWSARLRGPDYRYQRHYGNAEGKMLDAADRVRSDLGLQAICRGGCPDPRPPGYAYP